MRTTLIVTSADALLSLACADCLHALLQVADVVVVPDMVQVDLQQRYLAPGTPIALAWMEISHTVVIESTEVCAEYQVLQQHRPGVAMKSRPEDAASEVLGRRSEQDGKVTLLFTEADARAVIFRPFLPASISKITDAEIIAQPRRNDAASISITRHADRCQPNGIPERRNLAHAQGIL